MKVELNLYASLARFVPRTGPLEVGMDNPRTSLLEPRTFF
jgi:hypothetical protein